MPFDKDGNWYEDYTGGGIPVFPPTQVIFRPEPQNYTFVLQQILDTLKKIEEELGYIKTVLKN